MTVFIRRGLTLFDKNCIMVQWYRSLTTRISLFPPLNPVTDWRHTVTALAVVTGTIRDDLRVIFVVLRDGYCLVRRLCRKRTNDQKEVPPPSASVQQLQTARPAASNMNIPLPKEAGARKRFRRTPTGAGAHTLNTKRLGLQLPPAAHMPVQRTRQPKKHGQQILDF